MVSLTILRPGATRGGRRRRGAQRREAREGAAARGAAAARPYWLAVSSPPQVIAVFGPTGVGKTAVAIALAERLRERGEDPVAVSADALQVYEGLPVLTGAASEDEQARLEHRLLGFVPVTETFSAGAYARRAHHEIDELLEQGRRPIVVGGTGLYLRAALAELDLRPPVPADVRERWGNDPRPLKTLHAAAPRGDSRGDRADRSPARPQSARTARRRP